MRFPAKIYIRLPGRLKFPFVREGAHFYTSRLKHYIKLELEERKAPSKGKEAEMIKQTEARALLSGLDPSTKLIALDERGKSFGSLEFAQFLRKTLETAPKLCFVIGGAFGLAEEVLLKADHRLSLSHMTLNHELALLVLLEQLYRAFTILSGEPYHK